MLQPLKSPALRSGDAIRILSLASPVDEARLERGCKELMSLGYAVQVDRASVLARNGFFAGSARARAEGLRQALGDSTTRAIFSARGGYGSNYVVDTLGELKSAPPKIFCGFSDVTTLQVFLWQTLGWVTLYGPMVGSGLDGGPDVPGGYHRESLVHALTETRRGWPIDLQGESLASGYAEGTLLGGCLTLIEATLGTAWELETGGAILVLEDCDMKPYQVDRALMHLKQSGKFDGIAGVICGEFPRGEAAAGGETVKDVVRRILAPLGVPVVWGAPVGHTRRAMLTLPLGVRARISAGGETRTDILEPAVM